VTGRTAEETAFGELATEARDPSAADLDLQSTVELVALMSEADAAVPAAVARARDAIASAIDAVAERLAAGGRLVYVGAGTSGRLAVVDAAECESTFAVPPGRVVALIAGGPAATATAQEEAEDDRDAGAAAVRELNVNGADAVVGLSASGRTPYVVAALEAARDAGATTVAIVSVEESELGAAAAHEIVVLVGPEVIAGSTRMKAGTAQKLVLNTLSTGAMVRLGRTYGNLMVDVVATNEKLRLRARRAVALAAGVDDADAGAALRAADGEPKTAIVALRLGLDPTEARARLAAADGIVRKALEG
jgi:N-acetylmuramic acid 6-phosphate etherase